MGVERGRCPKCGHEKFETRPSPKLDDYVTCVRCRHRFQLKQSLGHVVERAQRTLKRKVDEINRKLGKLIQ